jgi:hypothetical protein
VVRGLRQSKIERIEGVGEALAHRWWRIWPKELADTADSGEGFRQLEAKSSREREAREESEGAL